MEMKNEHIFDKKMSRREFLKRGGKTGAAIVLASTLSKNLFASGKEEKGVEKAAFEVIGATPKERALNSAKELAKNYSGAGITVMAPTGSLGNMKPFAKEWEDFTGVPVTFFEGGYGMDYVSRISQETVSKTGEFDIAIPPPSHVPTFAAAKLAVDLTDWVKRYNPELDGPNGVIPPLDKYGCTYKGRNYMMDTDGDAWVTYYRTDYLTNPKEQKNFKAKFGYDLKVPETFPEYADHLKFFNRPDEGFYGGCNMFGPFTSKWMFFQAYTSKGKFYFNDNMEPEINSKEGVEALQYLQDIAEYQIPGAFSFDWGGVYGAMTDAAAYSTHTWVSFANYNNREGSKTRGKITPALAPGWDIKGTVCHATPMADSWSYIVSAYSKYPELAYLWVQYNQSPQVSTKAIMAEGGYFDPFRKNHFEDPEVQERFGMPVLDALLASLKVSFPDVILVGGAEYMDLLDKEVQAAVTGIKTAKKALDDAAAKWEEVTERYGREGQLEQWNWLKQFYPQSVRDAAARKA